MRVKDREHRGAGGPRAILLAAFVLLAGLLAYSFAGCGAGEEGLDSDSVTTTAVGASGAGVSTTAAAYSSREGVATPAAENKGEASTASDGDQLVTGGNTSSLEIASQSLGRKVISNASLQIEVERGKFQSAMNQAMLLADKYGGYIVSSQSSATGEEGVIRNGTIAIRVPSETLLQAMQDAEKLGEVTSRQVDSQDVTEEYVDLKSRLSHAENEARALSALLDRAKNIDEVLRVRSSLSGIQQEIEQLKGRIRFLDEHSSYSTLTMNVYEQGVAVAATGGWGFTDALSDALRAFVRSVNGIVVAVAGALPILVVLVVALFLLYLVLRPFIRRYTKQGGQPS